MSVEGKDYLLFNRNTRSFIYNMQSNAIQRMLDFDYICKRRIPSVAGIINPTSSNRFSKFFFGDREILIPIYNQISSACLKHPQVDVLINFASFRSAADVTEEALEIPQIRTIVIIAEGIPERRTKQLIAQAKKNNKAIIGPSTVGGIVAGAFKIGNTAGSMENIIESRLYRPGSVGFVSKSGGMSNEVFNIIARSTDGLFEGIAIGGDRFPGTTLLDHLLRFEKNPEIKMLVCLGEIGGDDEYDIVDALRSNRITKPLVIWVTGTCAKLFKTELQFGHAGAKAGAEHETADAKNAALRAAGAIVPASFDGYAEAIRDTYNQLVANKQIILKPEPKIPVIPLDYSEETKKKAIRRPTNFISTISDDRGEELVYGDMKISEIFQNNIGIGGVLSILWFKKLLPEYATKFIEMAIMVTADHGPAVSGAHNTIVTARAGKDMLSSLVSGLLTIGPRFGGALDEAAMLFSDAYDSGKTPREFVNEMKAQGRTISGIGHRIKSIHNPDTRVLIISEYAAKNFKETPVLDYAREIEKITTSKRDNLILNVDGCLGACFVDLLRNEMSKEEADEYTKWGFLNGLFVLGRTIGLIGHYLDQKRLNQGLYRHPWDDILYLLSEKNENY